MIKSYSLREKIFASLFLFFCQSTDVYNVMVFSGKQCWRRNDTVVKQFKTRTKSPQVQITKMTNHWMLSVEEIPTHQFLPTITIIIINLTNLVSLNH